MSTIISLISDQTIPNLLFIKELGKQEDNYIFVGTPIMQSLKKAECLIKAAGLPSVNCTELVLPDENDIGGMNAFFEHHFAGQDDLLVNITCGTKPMFLAAFNFFSKRKNKIYYMPIGRNIVCQLFPGNDNFEVKYRLNVNEYLKAHGISYESLPPSGYREYKILKRILKEYSQNNFDPEKVAGLRDNEHKGFFTGGWFEQFVYYRLRDQFNLQEGFIESGLKVNNLPAVHRAGFDNEFDVVFTYNNELFVIEAKVSIGQRKINKSNLDNILFKLGALSKNFGLRSHAWVVTLADLSNEPIEFKTDLSRKMRVLGIEGIEDRNTVINPKHSDLLISNK